MSRFFTPSDWSLLPFSRKQTTHRSRGKRKKIALSRSVPFAVGAKEGKESPTTPQADTLQGLTTATQTKGKIAHRGKRWTIKCASSIRI